MRVLETALVAVMIVGLAACQSGQKQPDAQPADVKVTVLSLPDGQGGEVSVKVSSNQSAGLLVSQLELIPAMIGFARMQRASLDKYGAEIYKAASSSDPDKVPSVAEMKVLQEEAREKGMTGCKNWKAGRSSAVAATASIYCLTWKDTLDANSTMNHNDFLATAGGAQYTRAKAEFLASAEEN